MCRYIVECVGMFYIVSVTGSLWNVSVYSGMKLYILEGVGIFFIAGGKLVECVGVVWNSFTIHIRL